jgi:hypothetical protein
MVKEYESKKKKTNMKQVAIRALLVICLFSDPEDGGGMFLRKVG